MARWRKSNKMKWQTVGTTKTRQSFFFCYCCLFWNNQRGSKSCSCQVLTERKHQRSFQKWVSWSNRKGQTDCAAYRRHCFKPAQQISNDPQGVIGRVSGQTINNHPLAANMPSRQPRKVLELTQQHWQEWLPCARDHVHWNIRCLRTLTWTVS